MGTGLRAVKYDRVDESTVLIHISSGDTILADAEDAQKLFEAEYRKKFDGSLIIARHPDFNVSNMGLARFILKVHGRDVGARALAYEDCRKKFEGTTTCYDVRKKKIVISERLAENEFRDLGNGITEMTVGNLKVVLNSEDVEKVKQFRWQPMYRNGKLATIATLVYNGGKAKMLVLSSFILSLQGKKVDKSTLVVYKNKNRLDFRRENLDVVPRENNSGMLSSTGHKGIAYVKHEKKYVAYVCINGVNTTLGYFDSLDEAMRVRNEALKLKSSMLSE